MRLTKCPALGAVILVAGLGAAYAQPADQDHHIQQGAAPEQSKSEPAAAGARPASGETHATPMMKGMAAQPNATSTPMMSGNMQPMTRMMRMMHEHMARHVAGHMAGQMGGIIPHTHIKGYLAFVKAELGITDAQMPQWSAFADALQARAQSMRLLHQQMMNGEPPATWPERLARDEQVLSAQLETVKAIEAPARALFAILSPEQKKEADELMGRPIDIR